MKTITFELPDRLAQELEDLIRAGWFRSEEEVVRLALAELIKGQSFRLHEEHQLEDIRWACDSEPR